MSEQVAPPPYLSPSSINTFHQCPLKFKFSRIDKIPEDPTEATLRGNFVHDVLEALYGLPPDERTISAAKLLARSLWTDKWLDEMLPWIKEEDLHNMRWTAWWCIEKLWELESPTEIEPDGLEFEINTNVSGVTIKGFIDRWSFNSSNNITVTDYKTGKTPRPQYRADKYEQLLIYAVALEALKIGTVDQIELLFLKDGDRLHKNVTDEDRERVTNMLITTKAEVDKACETGTFVPQPTRLCDWCSFKPICPAWKK